MNEGPSDLAAAIAETGAEALHARCMHEAGHATAALCLGLDPLYANAFKDATHEPEVKLPPGPENPTSDYEWHSLIFAHAGCIAELGWIMPREFYTCLDRRKRAIEASEIDESDANRFAYNIAKGERTDAERVYYAGRREARNLLRARTRLLDAISSRLKTVGYLDGETLQELFREFGAAFDTSVPELP